MDIPEFIRQYRYRGAHRKPTEVGRTIARAAVALAPLPLLVGTSGVASADVLDEIEQCESSGNENASNGTHFGLFQFDLATWRSVGGTGDPRDASRAEQRMRAELLLAARGTQPWNASRSCWGAENAVQPGERRASTEVVAPAPAPARRAEPVRSASARSAPAPVVPASSVPTPGGTGEYVVKSGDTLSEIAAAHDLPGGWLVLAERNRIVVEDPHWIFPGERLEL